MRMPAATSSGAGAVCALGVNDPMMPTTPTMSRDTKDERLIMMRFYLA
jgi:hypothetical protein